MPHSLRAKAPGTLFACLLMCYGAGRSAAQDDPLEKIVDDIVNASPGKDELGKKETLPDGTTEQKRDDGVKVRTGPEGNKQFISPDGTKVSILSDGQRIVERPGQERVFLPPRVRDNSDLRRHRVRPDDPSVRPNEKPPQVPQSPAKPAPLDPSIKFQPPEGPPSTDHAPWQSLDSAASGKHHWVDNPDERPNEPRTTPPRFGEDDNVTNQSRLPSGTEVFVRESGMVQTRLPDGTVITNYPGLNQIAVRDPDGSVKYATPGEDGAIRAKAGDATVTVDPTTGKAYIERNGMREVVTDKGSAWSDGEGGSEARGPDGRLRSSQVLDPSSGYAVRQDGDGSGWVIGKDGNVIGKGQVEGGRYVYRELLTGKEMPINELVDARNFKKNNAAAGIVKEVAKDLPPRSGRYTPPPAGNIFEINRQLLRQLQQDGRLRTVDPEQIRRMELLEKIAKEQQQAAASKKFNDDIARTMKAFDAAVRKEEAERELKRVREQIPMQADALEKEKKRVDADKAQLLLRETRVENGRKQLKLDSLDLQVARGGLGLQKTLLDGEEASLARMEKAVKEDLEAALKRIDYSKYNLCPNKEPWNECGHGDLKKKWLNAQLAGLLGKDGVARLQKVKSERDELNKKKKEYQDKVDELDQKETKAKAKSKDLDDEATSLKAKRDELSARGNSIQKELDQTKAKEGALAKQVAEFDAAVKKYSTPPE